MCRVASTTNIVVGCRRRRSSRCWSIWYWRVCDCICIYTCDGKNLTHLLSLLYGNGISAEWKEKIRWAINLHTHTHGRTLTCMRRQRTWDALARRYTTIAIVCCTSIHHYDVIIKRKIPSHYYYTIYWRCVDASSTRSFCMPAIQMCVRVCLRTHIANDVYMTTQKYEQEYKNHNNNKSVAVATAADIVCARVSMKKRVNIR